MNTTSITLTALFLKSTKKLYIMLILYVFISFFISAIFIHWFNLINELWNCIIICMFMSYWPNQKYVVITWHIYFCLKKINSNRLVYNLVFLVLYIISKCTYISFYEPKAQICFVWQFQIKFGSNHLRRRLCLFIKKQCSSFCANSNFKVRTLH